MRKMRALGIVLPLVIIVAITSKGMTDICNGPYAGSQVSTYSNSLRLGPSYTNGSDAGPIRLTRTSAEDADRSSDAATVEQRLDKMEESAESWRRYRNILVVCAILSGILSLIYICSG